MGWMLVTFHIKTTLLIPTDWQIIRLVNNRILKRVRDLSALIKLLKHILDNIFVTMNILYSREHFENSFNFFFSHLSINCTTKALFIRQQIFS